MALPLLHAGTGAGGVPDVGALKWSSGGAFVWSDDNYIVPALDLNFALFKDIRPRIGPTPTFTRASTGAYFDSSGVLTTASINGPRFDYVYNGYSWESKGLLIEEARTNFYLHSEDFSQGNTLVNVTLLTNQNTAPDGNTAADKVTATASTAIHYIEKTGYSVASSTAHTISIFAKYGTHRYIQLTGNSEGSGVYANFDLFAGSVGSVGASTTSQITNVGNGWYRCSVTYTTTTTASRPLVIMVSSAAAARAESNTLTTNDYFLIWGCQQEAGSFPTSYIPTTTAAVTRSADVCQITGGDFTSLWNLSAGTIVVDGDSAAGPSITGGAYEFWSIHGTPTIEYYYRGNSGYLAVDNAVRKNVILIPAVNTRLNTAIAFAASDFAASVNGAGVTTSASMTMPVTPTVFGVGNYSTAGGFQVNGHIARLRYFNTRLTNSQLQELST